MTFNPIDDKTGKEHQTDERGQYVTKDYAKFSFWAEHDEAGMTCEKCKKAIWYFA
ncbi:hypothetical protein PP175_28185 (plasmid) [Aneurinibacillus sp. Ricciae_BoGa-3]|uniref:hypothetical protein n=1 Tax=Aneurinibacillus sp. Ricciae_BoGa-3 TaxID=3022697 RepID=UPI00234236E3|nr:hypothetical protein [Aneurinibacillus sp. Ricciae_BoGa-3]WCK57070.1 hypothetical protein PP175_28185 [Aneurinibacillus sp. Ricciae_BoGa-3]